MDSSDSRVVPSEAIDDLRRTVATAVIDDNDLELLDVSRKDFQRPANDYLDVFSFVVGGEDERQRSGN